MKYSKDGKYYNYESDSLQLIDIGGSLWGKRNFGTVPNDSMGIYIQQNAMRGYLYPTFGVGDVGFNETYYGRSDVAKSGKFLNEYLDSTSSPHVPTFVQMQDLISATNISWVDNFDATGYNGVLFTDKNNSKNKLFFIASGYCEDNRTEGLNTLAAIWLSGDNQAYSYNKENDSPLYEGMIQYSIPKYRGLPLRWVIDKFKSDYKINNNKFTIQKYNTEYGEYELYDTYGISLSTNTDNNEVVTVADTTTYVFTKNNPSSETSKRTLQTSEGITADKYIIEYDTTTSNTSKWFVKDNYNYGRKLNACMGNTNGYDTVDAAEKGLCIYLTIRRLLKNGCSNLNL